MTPDERRHVAARLGLRIDPASDRPANLPAAVTSLAAPLLAGVCAHPACGRRQAGPGHPRKGWVKVHQGSVVNHWFCSWGCAAAFTARRVTP